MKWYQPEKKTGFKTPVPRRKLIIAVGFGFLFMSLLVLGVSIGDIIATTSNRIFFVEVPGFRDLHLKKTGLYAGIYQSRGSGPLPLQALKSLDVRLIFKDTYASIPVVVNTTGQSFESLGMKGMPVFNFAIDEPGDYSLSAVYTDAQGGPSLPVTLVAQGAETIRATLLFGAVFFALFLGLGIWVLIRVKRWAPKP